MLPTCGLHILCVMQRHEEHVMLHARPQGQVYAGGTGHRLLRAAVTVTATGGHAGIAGDILNK